jgi:hypothetical protein
MAVGMSTTPSGRPLTFAPLISASERRQGRKHSRIRWGSLNADRPALTHHPAKGRAGIVEAVGETMKLILIATIVGITGCGLAMQSKTVLGFWANIYPTDPARREALNLCALADPNFNRVSAGARTACYQHTFEKPAPQVTAATAGIGANQVDLRRAASATSAPRNDIRLVQQSDGSIR